MKKVVCMDMFLEFFSRNDFCQLDHILSIGSKVEGILRQSADVEEVDLRVHKYEQGTIKFIVKMTVYSQCI